jgi:hypothetical protein
MRKGWKKEWKKCLKKGYRLIKNGDDKGWMLLYYAHRLKEVTRGIKQRCFCDGCDTCGCDDGIYVIGKDAYEKMLATRMTELENERISILQKLELFCTRHGL